MKTGALRRNAVNAVLLMSMAGSSAMTLSGADQAPDPGGQLAIREVTVFKDGHALITRRGRVAADASGEVRLDDVPAPVLGTFWPFVSGQARLKSAAVKRERVQLEKTALQLSEFLEANVGAEVVVTETASGEQPAKSYPAVLLAVKEKRRMKDEGH